MHMYEHIFMILSTISPEPWLLLELVIVYTKKYPNKLTSIHKKLAEYDFKIALKFYKYALELYTHKKNNIKIR